MQRRNSSGPYIAIVGTRMPTNYGERMAKEIAYGPSMKGFCVVSGMARGIDACAHQGALDANGKTIAFLGNGLDIVYPPEHYGLYQEIASLVRFEFLVEKPTEELSL